jgi:hypothetical protein
MAKVKITLPDHLTVRQYQDIGLLEHLTDLEKAVHTISILCNIPLEEVEKFDLNSISKITADLTEVLKIEKVYYPIIQMGDTVLGYSTFSKMKTKEALDLENLAKDPVNNLTQILALLYRPIKKNKLTGLKFTVKNTWKVGKGDFENIYDYYTLEEYDSEERKLRAKEFENLNIDIALGALEFFFLFVAFSFESTNPSLTPMLKEMEMDNKQRQLQDTMVGSTHLPFLPKVVS